MNGQHGAPEPGSIAGVYALVIGRLVMVGFVLLVLGFVLYSLALLPAGIDAETTAGAWHLRASELAAQTGYRGGWAWIRNLPAGDALAAGPLSFLAGITILAFSVAFFLFIRARDTPYIVIVVLQIAILAYAALTGH